MRVASYLFFVAIPTICCAEDSHVEHQGIITRLTGNAAKFFDTTYNTKPNVYRRPFTSWTDAAPQEHMPLTSRKGDVLRIFKDMCAPYKSDMGNFVPSVFHVKNHQGKQPLNSSDDCVTLIAKMTESAVAVSFKPELSKEVHTLPKWLNDIRVAFEKAIEPLSLTFHAYFSVYPQTIALNPHSDEGDQFILHVGGTKTWYIYVPVPHDNLSPAERCMDLAYKKQQSSVGMCSTFTVESLSNTSRWQRVKLTLRAGDMLYLPSSTPHHCVAEGESLHLALQVHRHHRMFGDLISAALEELKITQLTWDKSVGESKLFMMEQAFPIAAIKHNARWPEQMLQTMFQPKQKTKRAFLGQVPNSMSINANSIPILRRVGSVMKTWYATGEFVSDHPYNASDGGCGGGRARRDDTKHSATDTKAELDWKGQSIVGGEQSYSTFVCKQGCTGSCDTGGGCDASHDCDCWIGGCCDRDQSCGNDHSCDSGCTSACYCKPGYQIGKGTPKPGVECIPCDTSIGLWYKPERKRLSNEACTGCGKGKFLEKQSSGYACKDCQAGYFQNKDVSATCSPCTAAGRFSDASTTIECRVAEYGHYVTATTSSAPNKQQSACPLGTIQPARGKSGCESCSVGLYSDTPAASQNENTQCKVPQAGYYVPRDQTRPTQQTPCPKGYEQPFSNGAACTKCKRGFYAASEATEKCTPCAAGYYSDSEQATSCKPCQGGTYQPNGGKDFCIDAPPGYYVPTSSVGQTKTRPCTITTYQPRWKQSGCLSCNKGRYCDEEALKFEKPCTGGKYQDLTAQIVCKLCKKGTSSTAFNATSDSTCVPCSGGTFQSSTGQSGCSPCGAGSASNDIGRPEPCTPCKPGTFSKGGAPTCTPCPAGTFQTQSNQQSCETRNCLSCETVDKVTGDCLLKAGYCVIAEKDKGRICRAEGAGHPDADQPCQVCNPAKGPNRWVGSTAKSCSNLARPKCSHSPHCIINNQDDGVCDYTEYSCDTTYEDCTGDPNTLCVIKSALKTRIGKLASGSFGCLIDGVVYKHGHRKSDCLECDIFKQRDLSVTPGWSVVIDVTTATCDDGDPTTYTFTSPNPKGYYDTCNSKGECQGQSTNLCEWSLGSAGTAGMVCQVKKVPIGDGSCKTIYVQQGVECRNAKDACDIAESCSGTQAFCGKGNSESIRDRSNIPKIEGGNLSIGGAVVYLGSQDVLKVTISGYKQTCGGLSGTWTLIESADDGQCPSDSEGDGIGPIGKVFDVTQPTLLQAQVNALQITPGTWYYPRHCVETIKTHKSYQDKRCTVTCARVLVDDSPPTCSTSGLINADSKAGPDEDYQVATDSIKLAWDCFDSQSNLSHYEVKIQTTDGSVLIDWHRIQLSPSAQQVFTVNAVTVGSEVTLIPGVEYVASLRIYNVVGLFTTISTDGTIADDTPPTIYLVTDGKLAATRDSDVDFSRDLTRLHVRVNASDKESGVAYNLAATCRVLDGVALKDLSCSPPLKFASDEQFASASATLDATLKTGETWVVRVTTVNNAGLTAVAFSDGVYIDNENPVGGTVTPTLPDGTAAERFYPDSSVIRVVLAGFADGHAGLASFDMYTRIKGTDVHISSKTLPAAQVQNGQQFDFPGTYPDGAAIEVVVTVHDKSSNPTTVVSNFVIIDISAPIVGPVSDILAAGDTHDAQYTSSQSKLGAYFPGVVDRGSGIRNKSVAVLLIDTDPATALASFVDVGVATDSFLFDNLNLLQGRSYRVCVHVTNGAHVKSMSCSDGVLVDAIAPNNTEAQVLNGVESTTSVAYWGYGDQAAASWQGFGEGASGILRYEYAVQSCDTDGAHRVIDWTATTLISFNRTDVGLNNGQAYCTWVRCFNQAGVWSEKRSSSMMIVLEDPTPGVVFDGVEPSHDEKYTPSNTTLVVNFANFTDRFSSISRYECCIGTVSGRCDVMGLRNLLSLEIQRKLVLQNGLKLSDGQQYFWTIRAYNQVNRYADASSNGVVVDTTAARVESVHRLASAVFDIAFWSPHNGNLTIQWEGITEPESTVMSFQVCLGSYKFGQDVAPCTNVGLVTRHAFATQGKDLRSNVSSVFATVKTINAVGLISQTCTDAIRVVMTAPAMASSGILVGSSTSHSTYLTSRSQVDVFWTSSDQESQISEVLLAVGTTRGGTQFSAWEAMCTDCGKTTLQVSNLPAGVPHFVSLSIKNKAGLVSQFSSPSFTLDTTAPIQLANFTVVHSYSSKSVSYSLGSWIDMETCFNVTIDIGTEEHPASLYSNQTVHLACGQVPAMIHVTEPLDMKHQVEYIITATARNEAGHVRVYTSSRIQRDFSPPVAPKTITLLHHDETAVKPVRDKVFHGRHDDVHVAWSRVVDLESGLAEVYAELYMYDSDASTIVTAAAQGSSAIWAGLNLSHDSTWCVRVVATNRGGITTNSTPLCFVVDLSPPTHQSISLLGSDGSADFTKDAGVPMCSWETPFVDTTSDIASVTVAIEAAMSAFSVQTPTNIDTAATSMECTKPCPMISGMPYRCVAVVVDSVGHSRVITSSDLVFDNTSPVIVNEPQLLSGTTDSHGRIFNVGLFQIEFTTLVCEDRDNAIAYIEYAIVEQSSDKVIVPWAREAAEKIEQERTFRFADLEDGTEYLLKQRCFNTPELNTSHSMPFVPTIAPPLQCTVVVHGSPIQVCPGGDCTNVTMQTSKTDVKAAWHCQDYAPNRSEVVSTALQWYRADSTITETPRWMIMGVSRSWNTNEQAMQHGDTWCAKVRATTRVGLQSISNPDCIFVDATAPAVVKPVITDANGTVVAYLAAVRGLFCNISRPVDDEESGLQQVCWMFGTYPGGDDVYSSCEIPNNATRVGCPECSLSHGFTYYCTVVGRNKLGASSRNVSTPLKIDNTPPAGGRFTKPDEGVVVYSQHTTTLTWTEAFDDVSNIVYQSLRVEVNNTIVLNETMLSSNATVYTGPLAAPHLQGIVGAADVILTCGNAAGFTSETHIEINIDDSPPFVPRLDIISSTTIVKNGALLALQSEQAFISICILGDVIDSVSKHANIHHFDAAFFLQTNNSQEPGDMTFNDEDGEWRDIGLLRRTRLTLPVRVQSGKTWCVKVRATNEFGLTSTSNASCVMMDSTPPLFVETVRWRGKNAMQTEQIATTSTERLLYVHPTDPIECYWGGAFDDESDIASVAWRVRGLTNYTTVSSTSVGATCDSCYLQFGQFYHCEVNITNHVGMSVVRTSGGITQDPTPPIIDGLSVVTVSSTRYVFHLEFDVAWKAHDDDCELSGTWVCVQTAGNITTHEEHDHRQTLGGFDDPDVGFGIGDIGGMQSACNVVPKTAAYLANALTLSTKEQFPTGSVFNIISVTCNIASRCTNASISIILDTTPPNPTSTEFATVYEMNAGDTMLDELLGAANDTLQHEVVDVDCCTISKPVVLRWLKFTDAESPVIDYAYAVGTQRGLDDLVAWTSVGVHREAVIPAFTVHEHGVKFYSSVRATNAAGLSTTKSSDGCLSVDVAKQQSSIDTTHLFCDATMQVLQGGLQPIVLN